MCKIVMTGHNAPYSGMRRILSSQDVHDEGEDEMTFSQRWPNPMSIPWEMKYFLMLFLLVRKWSLACDILEEHPMLLAPRVSQLLQDVAAVEGLSAQDAQRLRTHIWVLELARTSGIERTRAILARFDA